MRSAAVLGTSYGAQLTADFAVRHPDRVERVVMVGPILEPEARRLPRLAVRWFRHSRFERRQMPLMWVDAIRAGPRRSFPLFRLMLQHRLEDVAPRVQAPALVVWGTCDLIVSREWAEKVTRMLPRGRLAVLPGVPHPANFTSPDELAGVVRPFLLKGVPRSGDDADQPVERRVEAHQ
jgi:2-hydroxy-6-oxonona-2,4-dienedioate hydrolase